MQCDWCGRTIFQGDTIYRGDYFIDQNNNITGESKVISYKTGNFCCERCRYEWTEVNNRDFEAVQEEQERQKDMYSIECLECGSFYRIKDHTWYRQDGSIADEIECLLSMTSLTTPKYPQYLCSKICLHSYQSRVAEQERLEKEKQEKEDNEKINKLKADYERLNKNNKAVNSLSNIKVNKFCTNCGTKLENNIKFCYECGFKVQEPKKVIDSEDLVLIKGCDWLNNELKTIFHNKIDHIDDFYISKKLITQKQFKEVTGINCSRECCLDESKPVNYITFLDAINFCNRLSIREGLEPVYIYNNSTNPDEWDKQPLGIIPESFFYSDDLFYNLFFSMHEKEILGENFKVGAEVEVEKNPNANGYRLLSEFEYLYARLLGSKKINVYDLFKLCMDKEFEDEDVKKFDIRFIEEGKPDDFGICYLEHIMSMYEIVDYLTFQISKSVPNQEDIENNIEIPGKVFIESDYVSHTDRKSGFRVAKSKK